jgi:hypothetical protein
MGQKGPEGLCSTHPGFTHLPFSQGHVPVSDTCI